MIQTSDDIPNLYAFQFLFANTFVHEIGGNLLITYLYTGRPVTPGRNLVLVLVWTAPARTLTATG